jgi:ABC-2 type transport system permease protein
MSSRAIKPKRDGNIQAAAWQSIEERAPSLLREQGPSLPRYVALFSLILVTVGGAALLFHAAGQRYLIGTGFGFFMLAVGVTGLLYHAFNEKDFQFRRLYGALAVLFAVVSAFLKLAPIGGSTGGAFLPYGALSLFLTLGFLLSFAKNESDLLLRKYALNFLAFIALANVITGFIGGALLSKEISEGFLETTGVIHLVIGLLFALGFVAMEGISTPRGLWAGRAIGVFGAALILVGLVRSLLPWVYTQLNLSGRPAGFFLPSGLILIYIGVEYWIAYLGICSDNKLVVLTRRELGSIFYSPIAYIVMIGTAIIGWFNFVVFINQIFDAPGGMGPRLVPEPIFFHFMIAFLAVIPLIIVVPIITMRMLSEEKRTGTLEVLLTSPVNEWHVVLAKFLAGLRFFMLCWALWCVFFIGLRIEGGESFDYRPIITFLIALFCMGASFIAMGLFFSSITRHQVLAAVLTFMAMMALTAMYWMKQFTAEYPWLNTTIGYVSYLDLLISCTRGTITPRLLVLFLSVAAFWLFLTTKVLESRKWS